MSKGTVTTRSMYKWVPSYSKGMRCICSLFRHPLHKLIAPAGYDGIGRRTEVTTCWCGLKSTFKMERYPKDYD